MVGNGYMLFSALLLGFAIYGTWYLYKLSLIKAGGSLSNPDALFATNDAMPMVGIIFICVLIFQFGLFKMISKSFLGKAGGADSDLKYFGEKATAQIQSYTDTNVEINNNPMVKFTYTYSDKSGTVHQGEDKMVIGKLEIGRLAEMKEKEVFYLPTHPGHSKFVENLKPNAMAGCLNGVLVMEAFIFSCILIGMYLDGIA